MTYEELHKLLLGKVEVDVQANILLAFRDLEVAIEQRDAVLGKIKDAVRCIKPYRSELRGA